MWRVAADFIVWIPMIARGYVSRKDTYRFLLIGWSILLIADSADVLLNGWSAWRAATIILDAFMVALWAWMYYRSKDDGDGPRRRRKELSEKLRAKFRAIVPAADNG